MRLTVVGSGTLVPDPKRASACHRVDGDGFCLLLDVGPGSLRRMTELGLDFSDVTHVAFSHFHVDHFGAFPFLVMALRHGGVRPRERPLDVIGPPGLLTRLDGLCAAFGAFVLDPGFPLRVHEVAPGEIWRHPDHLFSLAAFETVHTESSVALRFEAAGRSVGYTGDTGPTAGLGRFLAGVDVLVTECTHDDPPPMDTHLTPKGVARLASEAEPKLTLVTHVFPGVDRATIVADIAAAGFRGDVRAADDGLSVLWSGEALLVQ